MRAALLRFGLVLALLGGAGCDTSSGGSTGDSVVADTIGDAAGDTGDTSGPPEIPAAWKTCTTKSDCAVVEIGCCDHCNGGAVVSVNGAYAQQADELLSPDASTCPDGCTLLGCPNELPTCTDGVCGHEAEQWGPQCDGLDLAACEASDACRALLGWPVAERCTSTEEPGVYAACVESAGLPASCDTSVPPWEGTVAGQEGGETYVFPVPSDACLPGWEHQNVDACPACAGLDEAACAGAPYCAGFTGWLVDGPCAVAPDAGAAVFLGCGDPEGGGGALTCGQDGAGTFAYFGSTALPPGWEPCDTSGCAEDCASLDDNACAANTACHLYLGLLVEAYCNRGRAMAPAGCGPFPGACDQVETCGQSPTGERLVFSDSCLPPGWTPCNTPACGVPCVGLDEAACMAADGCLALSGAPVDDWCAGDLSTWMSIYAGCGGGPNVGACGDAETCGMSPTGAMLAFPSTCLPHGWAPCPVDPCAGGQCTEGDAAPPGKLCVRGTPTSEGEVLTGGEPLKVQVHPKGCFSSSCTTIHEASCTATGAGSINVDALFCLSPTDDTVCTPDCSGGGFADCATAASLPDGVYTVTMGDLSVTVTVPDTLPFGGLCAGSQF